MFKYLIAHGAKFAQSMNTSSNGTSKNYLIDFSSTFIPGLIVLATVMDFM